MQCQDAPCGLRPCTCAKHASSVDEQWQEPHVTYALKAHGHSLMRIQHAKYAAQAASAQVTNCTTGVLPILAQEFTIAAQATQEVDFEIYESQTTAQRTNVCTVQLLDSEVPITYMPTQI